MTGKKLLRWVTAVVVLAVLVAAGYIMAGRIGLVDSLDFGAGAYYYADIPEFEKLEKGASFTSSVPMWVHILLFLVWGFLMYRLWIRVDRGRSK